MSSLSWTLILTEAIANTRGFLGQMKRSRSIWVEDKVQEGLDGAIVNKAVLATIAEQLKCFGYSRGGQQCCVKIKDF